MSWCTSCWYQTILPVLMLRHTSESEKRLFPGRWPPYTSLVADSIERYTKPSSGSAENGPHTPALPVYCCESPFHVSEPASPSRGMVWNVQILRPVRTS